MNDEDHDENDNVQNDEEDEEIFLAE